MNSLESIRSLFRHMEWADALVWREVLEFPPAAGDAGVKQRLHHSHLVQHAFLNTWRRVPHTVNAGSALDLAALAQWAWQFHAEASAYLAGIGESVLDEPIELPWARLMTSGLGREPAVPSLGETALQVALHTTHHRGQINALLRELGAEPQTTDFIAWPWLGLPAPEWPAEAG